MAIFRLCYILSTVFIQSFPVVHSNTLSSIAHTGTWKRFEYCLYRCTITQRQTQTGFVTDTFMLQVDSYQLIHTGKLCKTDVRRNVRHFPQRRKEMTLAVWPSVYVLSIYQLWDQITSQPKENEMNYALVELGWHI